MSEASTPETTEPAVESQPETVEQQASDVAPQPAVEKPAPVSKAIRTIAAKEKALREREQAIKDAEAKIAEFQAVRADAKKNPLKYLELAELTPEQVNRYLLELPEPEEDPGKKALAEVEAMKAAQAKAIEDERASRQAQLVHAVTTTVEKEVLGNEKYDLITSFAEADPTFDPSQTILDYMTGVFQKDGTVLSIAQAADEIEAFLEKKAERLAKSKKVQSKFTPPKPAVEDKPASGDNRPKNATPGAQDQALRTLQNSHAANVTDVEPPRLKTQAERDANYRKMLEDLRRRSKR
jgi:hypothetical protein